MKIGALLGGFPRFVLSTIPVVVRQQLKDFTIVLACKIQVILLS
jgi:hypothetical protein